MKIMNKEGKTGNGKIILIKTRARAKINLFLRVCGTTDNGYHRLYMLMQEVGLCDELSIELDYGRPFGIEVVSGSGVPQEKDLCYRAAGAFYDRLREIHGRGEDTVRIPSPETETDIEHLPHTLIKVKKNIPSQAGLGGGSSDAAAVLMSLNEHFRLPLTRELGELSAGLGADVPFFLYGGSRICEGIGEIIRPVPSLAGVPVILIKPEQGVSTPECFRLSDESRKEFDEDSYRTQIETVLSNEELMPLGRIKNLKHILINDLEAPAISLVPAISDVKDELIKNGAVYASMTGSGSCVFGIFEDEMTRDSAFLKLRGLSGCQVFSSFFI